MKALLLNAGSTSVKWRLFDIETEELIAKGGFDRIGLKDSTCDVDIFKENAHDHIEFGEKILTPKIIMNEIKNELHDYELIKDDMDDLKFIGHRIVSGPVNQKKPLLITDDSLSNIIKMNDGAPLHNPSEIEYLKIAKDIFYNKDHYAVFDSSFFYGMNEENAIYAIPYDLTKRFDIVKKGEHGINHTYLNKKISEYMHKDLNELKTLTIHLGGGASIASTKYGQTFNTSMGYTPLTGLVMGTRSGDIDPSVIDLLIKKTGMTESEVINILNNESGIYGVSGISSDMRDIISNKDKNNRAKLAYDLFMNKLIEYVSSFYVELDGVDAIAISGGIGEHMPKLRKELFNRLSCLDLYLDNDKNDANKEGIISSDESETDIFMIPANEELEMLRQIKEI